MLHRGAPRSIASENSFREARPKEPVSLPFRRELKAPVHVVTAWRDERG